MAFLRDRRPHRFPISTDEQRDESTLGWSALSRSDKATVIIVTALVIATVVASLTIWRRPMSSPSERLQLRPSLTMLAVAR